MCAVLVFSALHFSEKITERIQGLITFFHMNLGRYPVAVITHGDCDGTNEKVKSLRSIFRYFGVSNIYEITNINDSKPTLEIKEQLHVLELLDRCTCDGDGVILFRHRQDVAEEQKQRAELESQRKCKERKEEERQEKLFELKLQKERDEAELAKVKQEHEKLRAQRDQEEQEERRKAEQKRREKEDREEEEYRRELRELNLEQQRAKVELIENRKMRKGFIDGVYSTVGFTLGGMFGSAGGPAGIAAGAAAGAAAGSALADAVSETADL